MDASQIVNNMNTRWNELLSNYYDHVATTFLKQVSEEYELNYEVLLAKSVEVKDEILNSAAQKVQSSESSKVKKKKPSMSALKNAKKAEIDAKREKNTYSDFSRTQLIEKCRERKLPVKRKNQDMVDCLLDFDKAHGEKSDDNISSAENSDSD